MRANGSRQRTMKKYKENKKFTSLISISGSRPLKKIVFPKCRENPCVPKPRKELDFD